MDTEFQVVHLPERGRYELRQGEKVVGYADAVPRGDCMLLPYVFIEPARRGGHLGTLLVQEMLRDIESKGLEVVPVCPFVVAFFRRHPEYSRMVKSTGAQLY